VTVRWLLQHPVAIATPGLTPSVSYEESVCWQGRDTLVYTQLARSTNQRNPRRDRPGWAAAEGVAPGEGAIYRLDFFQGACSSYWVVVRLHIMDSKIKKGLEEPGLLGYNAV
jgi:hypothetical protein